jgi:hypothetical protein
MDVGMSWGELTMLRLEICGYISNYACFQDLKIFTV